MRYDKMTTNALKGLRCCLFQAKRRAAKADREAQKRAGVTYRRYMRAYGHLLLVDAELERRRDARRKQENP